MSRSSVVATVVCLLMPTGARADEQLARSGALQRGISVDLLELGPLEVHSAGGTGYGVRLAVGGEYELGPHWAFRMPLVIGVSGAGTAHDRGFAELDVVPGVVYRFRRVSNQTWVPYAGGGLKLGAWGADRPLIGQPLAVARTAPDLGDLFEDHHHTGGSSGGDPNFDIKVGVPGSSSGVASNGTRRRGSSFVSVPAGGWSGSIAR